MTTRPVTYWTKGGPRLTDHVPAHLAHAFTIELGKHPGVCVSLPIGTHQETR